MKKINREEFWEQAKVHTEPNTRRGRQKCKRKMLGKEFSPAFCFQVIPMIYHNTELFKK